MSRPDEEPDAPLHGECATEIRSLRAQLEAVTKERDELRRGCPHAGTMGVLDCVHCNPALARAENVAKERDAAMVELRKRPWIDGDLVLQGEHEADVGQVGLTLEGVAAAHARVEAAENKVAEAERAFDCHEESGCSACVTCLNKSLATSERNAAALRAEVQRALRFIDGTTTDGAILTAEKHAQSLLTTQERIWSVLHAALSPDAGAGERKYPCDKCGKLRTKAEGGTTFTVCDACWDAAHVKPDAGWFSEAEVREMLSARPWDALEREQLLARIRAARGTKL